MSMKAGPETTVLSLVDTVVSVDKHVILLKSEVGSFITIYIFFMIR